MVRSALLMLSLLTSAAASKPHIILMPLDDVGWADMGYHNSDFPTPVIDRLATTEGVRLENYYVQQVCSPTRSALMTGRYPFRIGMQHATTLTPGTTAAIPKETPTIAEQLKSQGYSTHAIGKWHLGYARWSNTPVGRGFDTYYGYLQGACDYYNKTVGIGTLGSKLPAKLKNAFTGYDLWNNKDAVWEEQATTSRAGHYTVDLYQRQVKQILDAHDPKHPLFIYFAHQNIHEPLQYPPEQKYKDACAHVAHTGEKTNGLDRHTVCAMMNRLDAAIGELLTMLQEKGMWQNTVLWVTTDNGGMLPHGVGGGNGGSCSSNYPLRGGKGTMFQGGVRGASFVTGGLVPASARNSTVTGLLQHVDIPTTLAALAGVNMSGTSDGFDVWNSITSGDPSPRQEVPVNVDTSLLPKVLSLAADGLIDGFRNDNALIQGKWKLISGGYGIYDGWSTNDPYTIVPPEAKDAYQKVNGHHVWLFDIQADPEERQNIAKENPDIVLRMIDRLHELSQPKNGYLDPQYNLPHPRSFPSFHNGSWAPFFRDDEMLPKTFVI
jgi:arylsulfatase B/arylsulfatase I/J